jgi:NADH:ubiquinone oxidoreductase subunit 5 (subunit L)/multisubunit Na+/H+ antiporter MnhA subunit
LILNRVGDFGFLCGVMLIFYFFRNLDFSIVFNLASYFKDSTVIIFGFNMKCLDLICFFLFLGSMGKSAQLGLHV